MEVARYIKVIWCLVFLCRKYSCADTSLKFSKDNAFIGLTCPAEYILFSNEDGLSTSQCFMLCFERGNCFGYFVNEIDGLCIGCKDRFPKTVNYPVSNGMLFYKAQAEFIITKYRIVEVLQTWFQSKEDCEALGGQLVAFRSNEERIFIETYILPAYGNHALLWIGGYDDNKDEVFLWPDNIQIDDNFMNWAPGEPYALDQNEQCVTFGNTNGVWFTHDSMCDLQLYGICELY